MADATATLAVPAPPPMPVLLKRVLALAGPTTLVAFLQSACQLIETFLAARQGTLALAAWAVVLPFSLLMQQMSTGAMGGGVVSAIARALGANRRDEASALVLHAMLIALLGGLLFAVILAGLPLLVFGVIAGPEAAAAAAPYAFWLFGIGAIPAWLSNTLASVLRGGGRHGLASQVLVVAWLAYPPLAWALMEPMGMGLAGVGAAQAFVFILATLAMGVIVWGGGAGFQPNLKAQFSGALFKSILSVGAVACTMAAIANLTTILVTARIAVYGATAVAAYGVAARLEFLMVPLAFGVGSALTALVGRAVGGGEWATARRIAWTGGLLALFVTGSVGLFVTLFPRATAAAFSSDASVVEIATRALVFTGPALAALGVGMTMYFAAMGAKRMRWPFTGALCRITIAVGGGWLLADVLGMGLDGQFLAVALAITTFGAIAASAVRPAVWPGAAK